MAAVVGLISVVIGGLSLARSAGRFGTGSGRTGAIVAAVVGLIGIVLAGLHLANSTGGFGTGSGRAGAIVAIVREADRHGRRWANAGPLPPRRLTYWSAVELSTLVAPAFQRLDERGLEDGFDCGWHRQLVVGATRVLQ